MVDIPYVEIQSITRTQVYKWSPVTEADQFQQIDAGGQVSDVTIVLTGTPGGATINFQGSHDGTNWVNLLDPAGNAIALTAAGTYHAVRDMMPFIRPRRVGGTGTSVTVTVSSTRSG